MSLFAYLLKNYERKVYIILMFKNSKLLHLFIPPEKKLCVGVFFYILFFYISPFQGASKQIWLANTMEHRPL